MVLGNEEFDTVEEHLFLRDATPTHQIDEPVLEHAATSDEIVKPWYRRADPAWVLPGVALMALSESMCMAPKLEILSLLICRNAPALPRMGMDINPLDVLATPISVTSPWIPSWLASGTLDPNTCRSNPYVQTRLSSLNLAMVTTVGILSSLTTGYWAARSSRSGRTVTLSLVLLGQAINDLGFLITVYFVDTLTWKFLLVGCFLEGLLGGMSTAAAVTNSYISDATLPGSRAKTFSILAGFMFAGFGTGPVIGGLLVEMTDNVVAPLYVSVSTYLFCAFCLIAIIPESLPSNERAEAAKEHEEQKLKLKLEASQSRHSVSKKVALQAKASLAFLKPLLMFIPRKIEHGNIADVHVLESIPIGTVKRDWSLTWIAVAYGFYTSLLSVYTVKMLYAQYTFSFGPVELGYLLTSVGCSRVFYLVAILPLAIKLFRRKPAERPEALLDLDEAQLDYMEQEALRTKVLHDSHFDLLLARTSVIVDALVYIGLLCNRSLTPFVILTCLQALGGGASPAMQSLALSMVPAKDAAQLFAALSVLQSLMAAVVGPFFFGTIWLLTFDKFAEAIFAVGTALFLASFFSLWSIRLRKLDGHVRLDV